MSKELLSDEIDTLTDKIEELEGENSHLTKEVDRLKHKLSLLKSDYEELDEKYEEIAGDWCSRENLKSILTQMQMSDSYFILEDHTLHLSEDKAVREEQQRAIKNFLEKVLYYD